MKLHEWLSMYVCMCVCVYIYIYIYTHTHMYLSIFMLAPVRLKQVLETGLHGTESVPVSVLSAHISRNEICLNVKAVLTIVCPLP